MGCSEHRRNAFGEKAAAEVKDAKRNLPRALALGTGLVTLLYIMANFSYLSVLPLHGDANGATVVERGIQFATQDRVGVRLRAPDAKRVTVVVSEIMRQVPGYDSKWATGTFNDDEVEMQRGGDGVWSLTVGPVLPDKYDYSFNVDGVRTIINLTAEQGVLKEPLPQPSTNIATPCPTRNSTRSGGGSAVYHSGMGSG